MILGLIHFIITVLGGNLFINNDNSILNFIIIIVLLIRA